MHKSGIKKASFLLQLIVAINLLLLFSTSNAAIITVTTDQDLGRNAGQTSIRDAFIIASSNGQDDTIVLSSDTQYVLDSCAQGPFTHSEDFSLTLQGSSASIQNICVDGTGTMSNIGVNSFTVENVEISGTTGGVISPFDGAAIRAEGSDSLVTVRDSDIHGFGGGGDVIAIYSDPFPRSEFVISNTQIHDNVGTAIRTSLVSLTMDNVTIARNTLAGISLVDGSPLSISHSFIKDNGRHGARTTGPGGGSVMKINNTEITGNGDTGAICTQCADVEVIDSVISDNGSDPNGLFGGGGVAVVIANIGSATQTVIRGSTVKGNSASHSGGGLYIDAGSETVEEDKQPRTDVISSAFESNQSTCAQCDGGGIHVSTGDLTISGSTISGNTAVGYGGGVSQNYSDNSIFSLGGSSVTNNQVSGHDGDFLSGHGGGLSVQAPQSSIGSSIIQDNTAVGSGGGMIVGGKPPFRFVTASVTDSTVSGNTAALGGGISVSIANGNEADGSGVDIKNSTVDANTASVAGGGFASGPVQKLDLNHVTVTGNSSSVGASFAVNGPTTLSRSIIAQPVGGGTNCALVPNAPLVLVPPITSNGFSWFSDNTCEPGSNDIVDAGGDPQLGPLADNGGPTPTRLPAISSPVVGLVPITDCPLAGDQRETPRPGGLACEAGAVEIAEGMTYQLPDNQWQQISLPTDPGNENKVDIIFGDDGLGTLGTDWAMFYYDTNNGGYIEIQNGDELRQGVGYWIIQITGSPQTLEMPLGSQPTPVTNPVGCIESAPGCFEIPLEKLKFNATQWHMVGYPFTTARSLSDSRVLTGKGNCAEGCVLDTAENEGIVHNQVWTYNGKSYDLIKGSDQLKPWHAYWSATLPDASDSAPVKLLIPKP